MTADGKQAPRRPEHSRIGSAPGSGPNAAVGPASAGPRRSPRIEIKQSAASPEEAAAIAAAIENFLRDTAPPASAEAPTMSPWLKAGLLEGAGREPSQGAPWGTLGSSSYD
jgi:hypothetical protein